MTNQPAPAKKTRAKRYTDEQIRDFELAGGAEGGMPAGQAGGPGEDATSRKSKGE